jgi:hypothetical protein
VSDADLQAQFELARDVRERVSEANQAVIRIRTLKTQIGERLSPKSTPALRQAADALVGKLAAIEAAIYQVRNQSPKDPLNFPIRLNNRLAALLEVIDSAEARPTQQSYAVFKELSDELASRLSALDAVTARDLTSFNRMLEEQGLEPVKPD